jgi:hypothetical protein
VAYNRKKDKAILEEVEEEEKAEEVVQPDPVRDEAIRIVNDLIQLTGGPKTVKVNADAAKANP